ncbi:hypothetical protein Poli38472_009510 [Pythium oligandrum]|uniref:Drug/Metabolite Transporter (DMT) Superfamily n=1 Tax=Pythium oligandrum TaxID=41045 RepID=A0A8K1CEU5_PYTOL|nr:hypothetical protein Poli38472_009510 [Pythium oligandrum]|eukprot:TMW62017.1 hypothetical protein Poli38472_009510 [Pythium oligandrum]
MNASQRFQLICFGFGQLIMFLNVITGVLSRYLTNENVSLPTLQSAFLYVSLAVVYLPIKFLYRRSHKINIPIWYYVLLALVDVEGNYFAVKAFNYANYVTVGLLLNLTVPFATFLCYFFLKTRYTWQHYLGAFISVCGSVVIFVVDYDASLNSSDGREIRGDIYCVIAALFYASSNVMIQYVVKVRDMDANIELLGFLGLFASIISAIQICSLELGPIEDAVFNGRVYGYMIGFVATLFVFYTVVSIFLRWSESLMFNLSLLTNPVFTVIASYFFFDEPVKAWYWFALVLFYIGLTLYTLAPAPQESHKLEAAPEESFHEVASPMVDEDTFKNTSRV